MRASEPAVSYLTRVPLPGQDEMREMVIAAFVTRSTEEFGRLARDIAAAQRDGQAGQASIQALHKRYRDLQAAAAEHEQLLGGSLDDARALASYLGLDEPGFCGDGQLAGDRHGDAGTG